MLKEGWNEHWNVDSANRECAVLVVLMKSGEGRVAAQDTWHSSLALLLGTERVRACEMRVLRAAP